MEIKSNGSHFNQPEVEAVMLTADDLSLTPARFSIERKSAPLATGYVWCTFQDDPERPPVHYLRSFTGEILRSGGFVRLGNTPVTPHTVLDHIKKLCPNGEPLFYTEVIGDPEGLTADNVTYEMYNDNPFFLYRFSSKHARFIESDVLNLKFDSFPFALVINENGAFGSPYIQQLGIFTGTYEGKSVTFYGGWDRMFRYTANQVTYGKLMAGIIFVGKRSDGCLEWGTATVFGDKSFAMYCSEGETPVASSNVKMENVTWETLPYLGDDTVTFTKATFKFSGKEIHYEAKWGYRGWDEESISSLKKNGYSLTSGVWYEGNKSYAHERSFTFAESHEAYKTKV